MLSAAAYPVVVFGSIYLPAILPQSDSLHTWLWDAHFYLAFAFFALVLTRVAAATRRRPERLRRQQRRHA
jgi:cytochrome b561